MHQITYQRKFISKHFWWMPSDPLLWPSSTRDFSHWTINSRWHHYLFFTYNHVSLLRFPKTRLGSTLIVFDDKLLQAKTTILFQSHVNHLNSGQHCEKTLPRLLQVLILARQRQSMANVEISTLREFFAGAVLYFKFICSVM